MHLNETFSADPEPLYELKGHRSTVLSVCFSPNGQNLVTGGLDSQLLFYRLNQSGHHFRLNGHTDAINSVHFACDFEQQNAFILSGSRDKSIRLWKYNSTLNRPEVDERSPTVYYCGSTVRFVHSSPDAQLFCTGSDDKQVKVWSSAVPNKRITSLSGNCLNYQLKNNKNSIL